MIFKCLICNNFSFEIICKECQRKFLAPEINYQKGVVNFYKYEDIEFLLLKKYHKFGNRIFEILAKNSFYPFSKTYREKAFIIPIDDKTKKGFSHTAILARHLQSKHLTPLFSSLHSKNEISYAGKSLEFRLNNPRNFQYRGPENIDAILVDDIYTTGTTINEAVQTLKNCNVNVLFSMVLAKV